MMFCQGDRMKRISDFNRQIILDVVQELCPCRSNRKVSDAEVLDDAIYVLETGIQWRKLRTSGFYTQQAVYKRFVMWKKRGVFSEARRRITGSYVAKSLENDSGFFKNLYIDSTLVKNQRGIDYVGRNPTDRGRMGTKLSVICDDNSVPLSTTYYTANHSDAKTIIESLDGMFHETMKDRRYKRTLVGDKGYLVKKETIEEIKARGFALLVPNKKNAKHPHVFTSRDKKKMKNRHKIENVFCRMDKFKRLLMRHDTYIDTFVAFHDLAICLMISDARHF